MSLANPGKPAALTEAKASEVLANFEGLDGRLESVEEVIDNIITDAQTYDNGVFPSGLTASEVSTELQYTSGSFIVSHVFYSKTSMTVDFLGYSAGSYYVEVDSAGGIDIYTSHNSARTNLNTVVWDGTAFTTVTIADRNVLATYQEIIDARASFDTLEDRLDADDTATGSNTTHRTSDGKNHSDVVQNTSDIGNIEDGTTVLAQALLTQTTATLTLSTTHKIVNCDTTSNAIAITVPLASSVLGRSYFIYVGTAVSAHAVTLIRSGSDVFISDGSSYTGATLTEKDFIEIVAVASGVWVVKNQYGVILS